VIYLIVVLLFSSLMNNDIEHLSYACQPFAYFLWRIVCSSSLPFLIQLFLGLSYRKFLCLLYIISLTDDFQVFFLII
jgi:hypothetical protein